MSGLSPPSLSTCSLLHSYELNHCWSTQKSCNEKKGKGKENTHFNHKIYKKVSEREIDIHLEVVGCGGGALHFMFMTSISGFLNVMTLCGLLHGKFIN